MGRASTRHRPVASSTSISICGLPMGSSSPHFCEQLQPVFAEHPLDPVFAPAAPFHCGRQIGNLADGADPLRVDYITKIGEAASIALVVSDPLEEWSAIS